MILFTHKPSLLQEAGANCCLVKPVYPSRMSSIMLATELTGSPDYSNPNYLSATKTSFIHSSVIKPYYKGN